jgi:DNA-binding response OmpR family regulator
MRILLVDDDPVFLDGLRHVLRRAGHEVEAAADGVEALERIEAAGSASDGKPPIRLMICDWQMPAMTGPDLCRAARGLAAGQANLLYILMLTSRPDAHRVDGLAAGADDYLSKPFDLTGLMSSIRAAELVLDGAAPPEPKRRQRVA